MKRALIPAVLATALAFCALEPAVAGAEPPPTPGPEAKQEQEKPKKREKIYDESADAKEQIAKALTKAGKENHRVLVQWGANWCGWCHRLEDWMAREEVAKILFRDFVDIKIDVDRTIGGQDLLERFTKGQRTGIPWYAVLEPGGEVLVTSSPAGKNIGYPYEPHEIEAFGELLTRAAVKITDREIEKLEESLAEARREIERRRAQRP